MVSAECDKQSNSALRSVAESVRRYHSASGRPSHCRPRFNTRLGHHRFLTENCRVHLSVVWAEREASLKSMVDSSGGADRMGTYLNSLWSNHAKCFKNCLPFVTVCAHWKLRLKKNNQFYKFDMNSNYMVHKKKTN